MSELEKQAINPSNIHPPFADYSHGVLFRNSTAQLIVSGQLGIGKDTVIPDRFEAQAELCFEAIESILIASGMDRTNTVRLSTYLTSPKYLKSYMSIRDTWIKGTSPPPASTLLIIAGFSRPEFKIEVEAFAVK